MKLTIRGRYAVMALLELAEYDGATPISLSLIAERQKLSLSYLELLFGKLRRRGLVKSVRGPGGGYVLAKPADDISIAHIITVVDPASGESLDKSSAEQADDLGFNGFLDRYLWSHLNQKMLEYLQGVSLADLLDQHTSMVRTQHLRSQNITRNATPLLSVMRFAS